MTLILDPPARDSRRGSDFAALCRQIREAAPECEILFDPKSSDPKRRRS